MQAQCKSSLKCLLKLLEALSADNGFFILDARRDWLIYSLVDKFTASKLVYQQLKVSKTKSSTRRVLKAKRKERLVFAQIEAI
jgi:hypothetical protein